MTASPDQMLHRVKAFREDRQGAVAILAALLFVLLIGFVALGTEAVSLLLLKRRRSRNRAQPAPVWRSRRR